MAGDEAVDKADIVEVLGWDWDDAEFRLNVAELIGTLCLMNHWMRGMLGWLTFTGAVKFTPAQQKNWNGLLGCLEKTEEKVWQLVPPRNFLVQIRALRDGMEKLDPEWMELLGSDDFGRTTEAEGTSAVKRIRSSTTIARQGVP